MIHDIISLWWVLLIIAGLVYVTVIRPKMEARRYSRSRLIRRKGEHSDGCGCRNCRIQ